MARSALITPHLFLIHALRRHSHRPFCFEAVWIRNPSYYSVIDTAWNKEVRGSHFTKLCKKHEATCKALCEWNKEVFGLCQTRINSLIHKISKTQRVEPSDWNGNTEGTLQALLREWLLRSDVLWHQKSRELWLKEGDKNTNFFHLSTIIRRRHNNIDAITGDDGGWITDTCLIRQHLQENFKNLFTAEAVNFPTQLEDLISIVISEEENIALCMIPTPEEIKSTLFHMSELKAPGSDGFLVAFYKNYYPIMGEYVIAVVTSFFTDGSMLKEVNSSLIILIQKVPNPSTFNNYRPISLCNVIYKIISKILVLRIRPILLRFISPS